MTLLDRETDGVLERLLARDPADSERVLTIDETQRRLTEKYIFPVLPQLEEEFLAIRQTVDANIRRRIVEDQEVDKQISLDKYPKGYCLPITVQAVAEFEVQSASAPTEATQAVAAFRRAGGHVTKIWGVLRNQYFQNAIQFGSIYFDVANDTVDVNKPKVEYMPIEESGFKNIDSYAEYADVGQRYWECEMYPNLYFPRLAPLLPVLQLSRDGKLTLESRAYFMQQMNVDSGFRAAETFLTESDWSNRRLPHAWQKRVADYKAQHLSDHAKTPPEGIEPKAVVRLCAEYRASSVYISRPFLTRVFQSAASIAIQHG